MPRETRTSNARDEGKISRHVKHGPRGAGRPGLPLLLLSMSLILGFAGQWLVTAGAATHARRSPATFLDEGQDVTSDPEDSYHF